MKTRVQYGREIEMGSQNGEEQIFASLAHSRWRAGQLGCNKNPRMKARRYDIFGVIILFFYYTLLCFCCGFMLIFLFFCLAIFELFLVV
jgi:hypothetical protein